MKCKQELDVLKEKENDAGNLSVTTEARQRNEKFAEKSELQIEQDKEPVVTLHSADLNVVNETTQPIVENCDAEISPTVGDEDQTATLASGKRPQIDSPHDSVCEAEEDQSTRNGEREETCPELHVLRQENQMLKQRIRDLANMDTRHQTSQTDRENQDDTENTASASCLGDRKGVATEQLIEMNLKTSDDEGEERSSDERKSEDMSEIQINQLQQQVEALQRRVKTLTEETQVQAQELTLWRLASQPASTVQHLLTSTEDEGEMLQQIPTSQSQSAQQPTGELTLTPAQVAPGQVQKSQDVITIIREDELSLCCSSKKLQGRMLFSRLQNNNVPEPKSLRSPKKPPQEQTHNADQESEKENQEINLQWVESCPEKNKLKKDAKLSQVSSQIAQHHAAEVLLSLSGLSFAKVESCYTGTQEAKLDSLRGTGDTPTNSSNDTKVEALSVGSQTEDSLLSWGFPKASAATQTERDLNSDEESVESPPVAPVSTAEKMEAGDKMLLSGSFPIPADPARLAERIRRSRTQLSAAFDDTEYEPYGLPEVVMKGFADIPSGPSCPYIVRRGLLGTVQPLPKKEPREDEETD